MASATTPVATEPALEPVLEPEPARATLQRADTIGTLVLVLAALGVVLRIVAWWANPAFWLDEVLLAHNIVELPLGSLLARPLELDQVAPPGFLLVERIAAVLLGPGERALRLFPTLCAVASVPLFVRLARRTLDGWAVPIAVALFAVGVPFLRYGAQVKQYGVDIAVATLLPLLAFALRYSDLTRRQLLLVALAGAAVAWVSQASVLIMAGIGLAFAVAWLRDRDARSARALLVVMPVWGLSSLAVLLVALHSLSPSTNAFMQEFWLRGFPPRGGGAARWVWTRLTMPFAEPTMLRYRWPAACVVVALAGAVSLSRRRRIDAAILLAPFVVVLGAALARQYPFEGRLVSWLLPVTLIATAAGLETVRAWLARLHPVVGPVLAAVFLVAAAVPPAGAIAAAPPPYDIEHPRELLAYLQRHRQPGDAIAAFPLTRMATLYYGPRYGLAASEWTTLPCHKDDVRAYLHDLDRYRGTPRLWIISATPPRIRPMRTVVDGYLGRIAVVRDSVRYPSLTWAQARLDLYDLSDPRRLASADAATFPIRLPPGWELPGCRPWSWPDGPTDARGR